MRGEDIDMLWKPSCTHIVVKGEKEEMKDQYWEAIHAIANQALHDIYLAIEKQAQHGLDRLNNMKTDRLALDWIEESDLLGAKSDENGLARPRSD